MNLEFHYICALKESLVLYKTVRFVVSLLNCLPKDENGIKVNFVTKCRAQVNKVIKLFYHRF
jgi:hypothetical protein